MTTTDLSEPLMACRRSVVVEATPEQAYALVSDLRRCGEWSPECTGGRWVIGAPGQVGSVFEGSNFRADDVVSWAPVVRGSWTTRSEVVAAEPGRRFAWAMQDSAGSRQQSVWGFDIDPAESGTVLSHAFRMDAATEGIGHITAAMTAGERSRFFLEWQAKIDDDLNLTLQRIKQVLEA